MWYIKDVVDLMSRAKYIENSSFDAMIKKTSDDIESVDEGKTSVYIFCITAWILWTSFYVGHKNYHLFFSFLYLESMLHFVLKNNNEKKTGIETVMSHYSLLSIIGISMTKAACTQTLNHQKIEKSERDLIKWHYSIHTRKFVRQGVCRLLWWVYHD